MTTTGPDSHAAPARAFAHPPWSAPPRLASGAADDHRLDVRWARSTDDVRAAQRLRWRVFVEEMGARLWPLAGAEAGLDVDLFDAHCEHLIVSTVAAPDAPARVVGTCRLLTPSAARRVGGLYTETEFDLVRLRALRPHLAEVGRACVHPAFRHGGVVLALWGAVFRHVQQHSLDGVIGCASVSMLDGGELAANLHEQLRPVCMAPPEWRVRPRLPLPLERLATGEPVEVPPLIRAYVKCGARLLGDPAWDPDFGTADLPMMLRLEDLPAPYRRRFQPA